MLRNGANPFLGPVEAKVLIKLLNITSYPLKNSVIGLFPASIISSHSDSHGA